MLRRLCLALPLISACSPWTDVSRPEDAPTASVLSPSDGAVVPAGRLELLGRAHDTEDPPENLFVMWSLGTDADDAWTDVCQGFANADTGESLCVTEVDATVTRVRMIVKDVAGFQRVVTQALVVRDVVAPTVTVLPLAAPHLYAETPFVVEAVVGDADGSVDALTLAWSSDVTGPIDGPTLPDEEGRLRGEVRLPEGSHTLTLSARDEDGLLTRASVSLHVGVPNTVPTVRIDAPTDDAVVATGAPLDLVGVALDSVSATQDLAVSWSSDVDGLLASPVPDALGGVDVPGVTLSKGDHVLTLSATDDGALHADATVHVKVDDPPALVLDGPVDGAELVWPTPLRVRATITDSVSPAADLRLRVSSDRSGSVMDVGVDAGGVVVAEVQLPLGTHVLTLEAVDGYGLVTRLTRTVSVVAP